MDKQVEHNTKVYAIYSFLIDSNGIQYIILEKVLLSIDLLKAVQQIN